MWRDLVRRFANGRPICNCKEAYLTPVGQGIDAVGDPRTDMLVCAYGCQNNRIIARDQIAAQIHRELHEKTVGKAAMDAKTGLKPCPCCGGAAVQRVVPDGGGHGESFDKVQVGCDACRLYCNRGHYTGYELSERTQSAIASWNSRA
jgi:Restriction alleviation protein Lar